MRNLNRAFWLMGLLALVGPLTACDNDTAPSGPKFASLDTTFATSTTRSFLQIERLANPLVSEVTIVKSRHALYNAGAPARDPTDFTGDVTTFVTGTAGRSSAYASTVASVLLGTSTDPGDKLAVFTARAPGVTASTAPGSPLVGWLTSVLDPTNGYGGRKLQGDDVVDKGLGVLFGSAAGNTANVSPGLVTDNVPANDKAPSSTFPYFPDPTP